MTEEHSTTIDLVGHQIFGDYEVIRKLGEGGMGAVFLAKHRVIDQKIAIKVLHSDAASSQELVERFNREAHVISLLSHPNIIRVFVFGRTPDDLMFLAMEFVEGMSLADYYETKGFPDELTAIKIVRQICSAVAEAHDLNIVHRDLKPENVLLTKFRGEEHYVKILDFGIAKMIEDKDQKRLTQAGIVYGTPDYLAPEQAMAQPLDGRCDIYSIGVMLFEIMTGQLPFVRENVLKTLQAHAFEPAPDPEGFTDRPISKTMRHIILKCLAKKREDRYQNALELFDALTEREAEILNERNLQRPRGVPGSEVTSIFTGLITADEYNAQLPIDTNEKVVKEPTSAAEEVAAKEVSESQEKSSKYAVPPTPKEDASEEVKTSALKGPVVPIHSEEPFEPENSDHRLPPLDTMLNQEERNHVEKGGRTTATIPTDALLEKPAEPKVRTLVNRNAGEKKAEEAKVTDQSTQLPELPQPVKFPPIVVAALMTLSILLIIAIILLVMVLRSA